MLEYKRLKKDRRRLLALTGLTLREFRVLHPAFRAAYETRYEGAKTANGRVRKRQVGGGRKGRLWTTEQKLLLSLVYQKTYPLQVLLGEVFELSQSQANRWIHRVLPVLKQALDDLRRLPSREPGRFAQQERAQGETREWILDGTERRRQRPKSPKTQALHSSGKRKTHSDKNVVVVTAKAKRVGYLSQTSPGKTHDKKIVDTEPLRYPRNTIKIPAFKDTPPKCSSCINRKKTAQPRVIPWTKAPQSETLTGPRPRGACPGRRETLPDRKGCLAQYQRARVRLSDGCRMWVTQSARALPQTAAPNMRKCYFA